MMRIARLLLSIVAISVVQGCKVRGKEQPYNAIGAVAARLRDDFNAGFGKVRVLMLVAPT